MAQPTPPQDKERPGAATASRKQAPSGWEWTVAGLGGALVVASVGYLGWQAVLGDAGAPQPEIELREVLPQGSRYLVRIRVHNRAGATAAGLRIEGALRQAGATVETSEIELRYLPGGSWREAGLFFSRDPRQFELQFSPRGYEAP